MAKQAAFIPDKALQLLQKAAQQHQLGDYEQAQRSYKKFLATHSRHYDGLLWFGIMRLQQGMYAEAATLLGSATKVDGNNPAGWMNLAIATEAQGRYEQALAHYDRAIELSPRIAGIWCNRAKVLSELGRHAEAIDSCDRALAIDPSFVLAYNNRGNALSSLERHEEALAAYDLAIARKPADASFHNNRGATLTRLRRHEEALASFDTALAANAHNPASHVNRGNALIELKRYSEALASFDQALALRPDLLDVHYNRGIALHKLKRYPEALASYDRLLAVKPLHAEALNNRGNTLFSLRRHSEALASCEKALALKPAYPEAFQNRGMALCALARYEDALKNCDDASALGIGTPKLFCIRGCALIGLKRYDDAANSLGTAIAADPELVEAYSARGEVFLECKRPQEALDDFRRASELDPDNCATLVSYARMARGVCDWETAQPLLRRLISRRLDPDFDGASWPLLAMVDDPAFHANAAANWARDKSPLPLGPLYKQRPARDRLRLGYLSADFGDHAVSQLMVDLFERHDRSRFEVCAFSSRPDDGSALRRRLEKAFDAWHDIRDLSDEQVARRIAAADIDILIDLGGYTKDGHILSLVHRPAPVQVSYLGYAGTSGAPFIDYAIADPYVVPSEQAQFFTERLAYLPDCFMCNDSLRRISDPKSTREENGLPQDGFVFCGFNNSYKIGPDTFDIWMRLLKAVQRSVLWLRGDAVLTQANLRNEAQARGVDPQRLVFAPSVDYGDHLARQKLADLFVDTWPYNAHTTASDALCAGLPVVTYSGTSFASRVAGSLLHAVGLPELATTSASEYEALARALASDPARLHAVRDKLQRNLKTTPLCDTDRFSRNIERAYQNMWNLHMSGAAPKTFHVEKVQ